MTRYSAVVETGSHSDPARGQLRYEEREHCGHAHKTMHAAETCGERHYASCYVRGSWQANAAWHGYRVHDQNGSRVSR